ncbi:MAG: hypothetical protein WCP85_25035, partial [Mariniphaga sp.]
MANLNEGDKLNLFQLVSVGWLLANCTRLIAERISMYFHVFHRFSMYFNLFPLQHLSSQGNFQP